MCARNTFNWMSKYKISTREDMINELARNGKVIRHVDADFNVIRPTDTLFATGYGESDDSFPSDENEIILTDENDIDWFLEVTDNGSGRVYESFIDVPNSRKSISEFDIDGDLICEGDACDIPLDNWVESTIIINGKSVTRRIDDNADYSEIVDDKPKSIGSFNNSNWFEITKSLNARDRAYELYCDTRKLMHLVSYLRDCKSNKRLDAIVKIINKEKESLSNTSLNILRNEYRRVTWRFRKYYMSNTSHTSGSFTYHDEASVKVVYGSFS